MKFNTILSTLALSVVAMSSAHAYDPKATIADLDRPTPCSEWTIRDLLSHLVAVEDRIVHIASPGAGPGVRGAGDYPEVDPLGRPRRQVRYSLTAPGDPVVWAQRFEAPWGVLPAAVRRRLQAWGAGLSLGVDPTRLRGVRILPAGAWEVDGSGHRAGDPLVGPAAHAGVTARGTSAFRRLVEVVGAPL